MDPFPELPLLRRELLGLLRTRRAFWLLLLVVAVSTLLPLLSWPELRQAAVAARQARRIFIVFALVQLSVVLLVIPTFTSGAISGERERGTYELLHTTLLSPFSIVLSKILGSASYVAILLGATAPSVCVFYLLGGTDFVSLLHVYGVTIAAILTTALICLTASMRSRRTAVALVRGIAWVVFYNGALTFLLVLAAAVFDELTGLELMDSVNRGVGVTIAFLCPYYAVVYSVDSASFLGSLPLDPPVIYYVYSGLLAGGHLLYLLIRVRKPELADSRRAGLRRIRPGRPAQRVTVRRTLFTRALLGLGERGLAGLDNPVLVKEIRSEFFGRVWYRRLVFWISLGLLLSISLVVERFDFQVAFISITALSIATVLGTGIAASALTREMEQGNIDFLRGTLLTPGRILDGKFVASLYAVWGVVAALGWALVASLSEPLLSQVLLRHWSLGGAWRILRIVSLAGGVVLVSLVFALTLSILCSVIFRRTVGALLTAYVTLLGIHLLPVLAAFLLDRPFAGGYRDLLNALSPHVSLTDGTFDESGSRGGACMLVYGSAAALLWGVSLLILARFRSREGRRASARLNRSELRAPPSRGEPR